MSFNSPKDDLLATLNTSNDSLAALSLNSMQLAILSLKEKYNEKQNQVEIMESERNQLIMSKENLYNELKKLHEANEKLREQNLKLSSDLEHKSKECVLLCQRLQDHGIQDYSNLSDARDLTNTSKYRITDDSGSSSYNNPELNKQYESDTIIPKDNRLISNKKEAPSAALAGVDENASDRILIEQVANNFSTIRSKIKTDQLKLLKVMQILQDNKEKTELSNNKLIGTLSNWNSSITKVGSCVEGVTRKCPMCEAEFPLNTSQDEFELHVVEHFSYDEAETLKNFDTLPDADLKETKDNDERTSNST